MAGLILLAFWMSVQEKIVGYSYGRKMDRSLVISALTNSWQNQNYPDNVILHSDRGSQYTSSEYIAAR